MTDTDPRIHQVCCSLVSEHEGTASFDEADRLAMKLRRYAARLGFAVTHDNVDRFKEGADDPSINQRSAPEGRLVMATVYESTYLEFCRELDAGRGSGPVPRPDLFDRLVEQHGHDTASQMWSQMCNRYDYDHESHTAECRDGAECRCRERICESCGRTLTDAENTTLDTDVDFVKHNGHLIRRVP